MHDFTMPDWVIEKVTERRGQSHVFSDMTASRTAMVVIDMQNGFLKEGVAHSLMPDGTAIVPNINRIAATLRAHGGTVAWIKNTTSPETMTSWSSYNRLSLPAHRDKRIAAMMRGSQGHQLWYELDAQDGDLFVEKIRFSAFIAGSSDLEQQLRDRGIDTVLVTGTATNVCCESTARDAMMRNFNTVMISDANCASGDREHSAALIGFYLAFGDVMTTDDAIGYLVNNETSAPVPLRSAAR
jgi:ureidoacrylate peracid hydrolase